MSEMQQLLGDKNFLDLIAKEEAEKAARDEWLKEQLATRLEGQTAAIDWTPLAAQLDEMAGSPMAQKAAASNFAQASEAQKDIDKLFADLGSKPSGKSIARDAVMMQAREGFKRSGIEGTQGKAQEFQEEQKDIDRKISADKEAATWIEKEVYDPLKQSTNDIGMAEEALANNDIAALNQSLPSIARGIVGQKGVLSDTDIALTIPKTYASSVAEFVKKINGEASIPPSLVKNVQALIARAKNNIHRNAQNALKAKILEAKNTTLARQKGYVPPAYQLAEKSEIVNFFKPVVKQKEEAPKATSAFQERLKKLKESANGK